MNYDVIIARYGEIGLKSPKIRARFERKLVKNIKATFECEVDRNQGIFVGLAECEGYLPQRRLCIHEFSTK